MDTTTQTGKPWTHVQAFGLAVICLALGFVTGYLLRAPAAPTPTPAPTPVAGQAPGMPPGHGPVTPEQLKHMVDKKAEPLLAKLKDSPNDPALLAEIGNLYYDAQQFDSAQEYYGRSVAAKPTAENLTLLANTYHYTGDTDKAIATFNRALQVDPTWADALFNLGMLEWQVKSDPKAAIALWEKLLKTNPKHPNRKTVEQMIERAKRHISIPPGTMTEKPTT